MVEIQGRGQQRRYDQAELGRAEIQGRGSKERSVCQKQGAILISPHQEASGIAMEPGWRTELESAM